jgi:transcriptional regulator with XRE-family HTH domain
MYQKILETIKEIRKNKGLSQSDMAKRLNLSHTAYGKIENGLTHLTIERILQLCKTLDINLFDILRNNLVDHKYDELVEENQALKNSLSRLKKTQHILRIHADNLMDVSVETEKDLPKDVFHKFYNEISVITDMLGVLYDQLNYTEITTSQEFKNLKNTKITVEHSGWNKTTNIKHNDKTEGWGGSKNEEK